MGKFVINIFMVIFSEENKGTIVQNFVRHDALNILRDLGKR